MSAYSSGSDVQKVESTPAADPAPLGLAGFAMATFLLSGHNASFIPDLIWVGPAIFYGGMAQFCAGMWEFRNRNVFGATAFGTYGGFWMGLGLYIILGVNVSTWFGSYGTSATVVGVNVDNALAWFLIAFAIFNLYMTIGSLRVNGAVFAVFIVLEATEIVLAIGFWHLAHGGSPYILHVGGWLGVVDAGLAWYTSAAGVLNNVYGRVVAPVGKPLVSEARVAALA